MNLCFSQLFVTALLRPVKWVEERKISGCAKDKIIIDHKKKKHQNERDQMEENKLIATEGDCNATNKRG